MFFTNQWNKVRKVALQTKNIRANIDNKTSQVWSNISQRVQQSEDARAEMVPRKEMLSEEQLSIEPEMCNIK